jgi:acyl transferase domain-containing protein/thioesterase domain-containing protein/acyl carrier protein
MPDDLRDDLPLGAAVADWVAARCGLDPDRVDRDCPLVELGISSVDAVELAGRLADRLGRPVPPTLLWEQPTVNAIEHALAAPEQSASGPVTPPETGLGHPPIAVVGVGCRFPGANGPGELWRLLTDGRDAVRDLPPGRWRRMAAGQDRPAGGKGTPGGFLDEVDRFDAEFFGIPPAEARLMDPQQRILLEVAWEALAHAALDPATLRATRTGAYVGICASEYAHLTTADLDRVEGWTATGGALSIAANRLSYLLDLRGPSMAVDSACSSSLVAVHLAMRDLRSGETDLALAAGVSLMLDPALTVAFDRAGGLAAGGRCRPFGADADGIVRGEGCGLVVLKRLTDAVRDGDRVLAVLRGGAVNSDGRSNGLVAPNPHAQEALLRRAYEDAGCPPSTVDYVEAHGTGTPLGDPIEAGALGVVCGAGRPPEAPLLIGSVKSRFGHLEAAAGVAGFITAVLALHHGTVPATLHADRPNPHIPMPDWGLRVVTAGRPLPRHDRPARAGVSAFGFGGTNAHLVLEAAEPTGGVPRSPAGAAVCVLTDRDPERIREQAGALATWLDGDRAGPHDVAATLARRGERGPARTVLVARDAGTLATGLMAASTGASHPAMATGSGRAAAVSGVWVFSGYGAHWPGMGRHLLEHEPAFAAAVDDLEPWFHAEAGFSLRDGLSDGEGVAVDRAQPLTFGLQVALAGLWRHYGVRPAAVIGHSMGEVAAAVVAGALSPLDGIRLICRRARLLSRVGPGTMAVAELTEEEFRKMAGDLPDVSVAVVAAPRQLVITGRPDAVAVLGDRVTDLGRAVRTVTAEGAGHSPAVDPLLPELREALRDLRAREPHLPFYSTVTGVEPGTRPVLDAVYWVANLRQPVHLADAVRRAAADGHGFFLEISPHPVLVRPLRATLAETGVAEPMVAATLRRDDPDAFDRALATLCAHGHRVPHGTTRVLDLPAPPWRGKRHWTDPAPAADREAARPALLAGLLGVQWRERPAIPADGHPDVRVTLLGDDGDPLMRAAHAEQTDGDPLMRAAHLEQTGPDVVLIAPQAGALPDPAGVLRFAGEAVAVAAATAGRLWLVTRGGAAVGPADPGRPDVAWLRGLVRTLALEQPLTRATWIDLDPAEDPATQAARLWAEVGAPDGEDEIAWRAGRRWTARLATLAEPARRSGTPVRAGAAYVVTGGYGGIGLRVAGWLASAGAGRIVLSGRSGPSPQALEAGEALRRSGVDVRIELGDLADRKTAERVVAAAGDRLAGVVHAAGVLSDGLVSQIDAAVLERVWAPKVRGAWQLHNAVQAAGAELDWWVSFSSAAALLGSPGQAAYAGANAWLDAFARWQRAHGTPARSIAWGIWSEVGGATGVRQPGLDPIAPDDGIAALRSLLAREPVDAGVLHFDPAAALAAFPQAARAPFLAEFAGDVGDAVPQHAAGPVRDEDLGDRLARHVSAVLGIDHLPADVPLVDLGLDSLAAIRIKSLVEADLGRAIPTSVLVRGATLADLTGALTDTPGGRSQGPRIGARDAAERDAVRLFETVLGRPVSGITHRAGPGDLARIAEAAHREFGILVDLSDDPTPQALAEPLRVAEQAQVEAGGTVRLLRAGGAGRPLFLAHPAGGSTVVYRRLVELLGPGYPVYGLERLPGGGPVAERAADYVALVRQVGAGPYRIGGWSFGGVLAFEMARQLAEAGEEVETVLLLDSGLPVPVPAGQAARMLTDRFLGFVRYVRETYHAPVDVDPERLRGLPADEQFTLIIEEMSRTGLTDRLPPAVWRHQVDSHWDTRALDEYQPGRYAGPVTLYRCTRPTPWAVTDPRYEHADAARGWDRWCSDLRIVPVDGHHLNLLDPPAVDTVAVDLRRLL